MTDSVDFARDNKQLVGKFGEIVSDYADLLYQHLFDSEGTDEEAEERAAGLEERRDLLGEGADDVGLQDAFILDIIHDAVDLQLARDGFTKNGEPYVPNDTNAEYIAQSDDPDGRDLHTGLGVVAGGLGMIAIMLAYAEAERHRLEMELLKAQILGPLAQMFGGQTDQDEGDGESYPPDLGSIFGIDDVDFLE